MFSIEKVENIPKNDQVIKVKEMQNILDTIKMGNLLLIQSTLSKYEYDILLLLAKSPGRIFGKEMVYDLVWNEPYSGDYNVVMRHICNIREKIEDDPGQPLYIQTVRGVGYRFNGNLGSE